MSTQIFSTVEFLTLYSLHERECFNEEIIEYALQNIPYAEPVHSV